jgi:hypothetical protein
MDLDKEEKEDHSRSKLEKTVDVELSIDNINRGDSSSPMAVQENEQKIAPDEPSLPSRSKTAKKESLNGIYVRLFFNLIF